MLARFALWRRLVSLALVFWSCASVLSCGSEARQQAPAAAVSSRPNLIVVLLDDADVEITESMPRLRSLFIEKGLRFTTTIANTPLCGPSRALLLTGRYSHNTRVYYNNGPEGGYTPWLAAGYDDRNLGPWLQAAGYRTGLFGKYMNDFPMGRSETFVPPGWNDFRGVMSDREARNNHFTLSENGALRIYEAATGGYQTDVLSERLNAFIRAAPRRKPFFAYLSLSAPHVPTEPAARHLTAFPDEKAPRKPSFDEADLSDKPARLREQAVPITPAMSREIDSVYRGMKQSLLAVEEAMEALLRTLAETGQLENTYIFFTSDNGWFRGEHRIPAEKYAPYEESIRVPLFVRGPGVAAGSNVNRVVGLVDLAPTLLELAGAPAADIAAADGRSLVPLLKASPAEIARVPWREATLIEHFGGGAPFRVRMYSGVRSESDVYVEYATGEKEYYDLTKDPYQMENAAKQLPRATLAKLEARVAALKDCAAAACRSAEGIAPTR